MNVWDDAAIDTLKRLWANNLTATEIAAAMEWPTRNAILGKVHRLGLAMRAAGGSRKKWSDYQIRMLRQVAHDGGTTQQAANLTGLSAKTCKHKAMELGLTLGRSYTPPPPRRSVPPAARPRSVVPLPEVKPMFAEPEPQPTTGGVTIMDLRHRSCRYIIRHGRSMAPDSTFYCGEPREDGLAWCAKHRAIVAGVGTLAERWPLERARRAAA